MQGLPMDGVIPCIDEKLDLVTKARAFVGLVPLELVVSTIPGGVI